MCVWLCGWCVMRWCELRVSCRFFRGLLPFHGTHSLRHHHYPPFLGLRPHLLLCSPYFNLESKSLPSTAALSKVVMVVLSCCGPRGHTRCVFIV